MGLVFQALFSSCCCSLVGWAISDMRASVFSGFGRVRAILFLERAGGYLKMSSLLEHTKFLDFGLQDTSLWAIQLIRCHALFISIGFQAWNSLACLLLSFSYKKGTLLIKCDKQIFMHSKCLPCCVKMGHVSALSDHCGSVGPLINFNPPPLVATPLNLCKP